MSSPVRVKKIQCPACGEYVEIFCLPEMMSGHYRSVTKESDQHVSLWQWKNIEYQSYNPYYYSIWFCRQCFYADFEDTFIDKYKDPNNKVTVLYSLLISEKNNPSSVINRLVKFIDYEKEITYNKAVYLHLLAIYIQELIKLVDLDNLELTQRNWKRLGRLYLRLAWLFREKGKGDKETVSIGFLNKIKQSLDNIKKNTMDIPELVLYTQESLLSQKKYESSKNLELNIYQEYNINLDKLIKINSLADETANELYNIYKKHIQNNEGKNENKINFEFKECIDILTNISNYWSNICINEEDALKQSIKCFRISVNSDRYMSDMACYKVLELLCDLYLRIFNKKEAVKCLIEIRKKCDNDRIMLNNKIHKTKDIEKRSELQLKLKKITTYMQEIAYRAQVMSEKL